MKARFEWLPQARAQLRAIDRDDPMRILRALTRYMHTGKDDVKALQGPFIGTARLRVGPYRVRFSQREPGGFCILDVTKRADAYR